MLLLKVLQELGKGTQMGALGFRAGFPMKREEKLVLEWEGRERRTTRQRERARPSLAGEGAAGGAPSCYSPDSRGDKQMSGSAVLTVLRTLALVPRKSKAEENPEAGSEGSA